MVLNRLEGDEGTHAPVLKSPMTAAEAVKVRVGMRAKGSCRLIRALSRSFIPDSWSMLPKTAHSTVGAMAISRVISTRSQRLIGRLRKPCAELTRLFHGKSGNT